MDANIKEKLLQNSNNTTITKYKAIISNPPYQHKNTSITIWDLFLENSLNLTEQLCMIHPARWLSQKHNAIHIYNVIMEHINHFIFYYESPFKDTTIDVGITITYYNGTKNNTYQKYPHNSIKILNKNTKFFYNDEDETLYDITLPYLNQYGNMSKYMFGQTGTLRNLNSYLSKHELRNLVTQFPSNNSDIRVWFNNGFGKGSRSEWQYLRKEYLNIPEYLYYTRKVMIEKTGHANINGGNIFNNLPRIIENNEINLGNQFLILPKNDTDEELEWIVSLFKSKFARALMYITQKDLFVRGIDNIPDYYELGQLLKEDELSSFTDKWLYKKFNIPDNVIDYIESKITVK